MYETTEKSWRILEMMLQNCVMIFTIIHSKTREHLMILSGVDEEPKML